jgi:glutamate dehydrogenase
MEQHPLRREIIATQVTNGIINRVGSTFVHRIQEETGASAPDVVRAYLLNREIFDFTSFWRSVEELDNKVADAVQAEMLVDSERLTTRATLWFLHYPNLHADIVQTSEHFTSGVRTVAANLDTILSPAERATITAREEELCASFVPRDLAKRVASFDLLYSALDIVEIAIAAKRSVGEVAGVYFAAGDRLNLSWVAKQIETLPADSHWQMLAKATLGEDLLKLQTDLARQILRLSADEKDPNALISLWEGQKQNELARVRQVLSDLKSVGNGGIDFPMLSVALRELKNLAL